MRPLRGCTWLAAFGTLVALSVPVMGSAQKVIALMSSDLEPYRLAYKGLEEELGHRVPSQSLDGRTPAIPGEVRVVVAIGSRAALQEYPEDVVLIYCMAPGTGSRDTHHAGRSVKIHMLPRSASVVAKIRELQPDLSRLAVFWSSRSTAEYLEGLASQMASESLEILTKRLEKPEDIPDRLRDLAKQEVDALWLLPDPLLVNARTFSMLKEFAWSNDVPFYAPTAGLVAKGAVASVSSSFEEIGRTAGTATRLALQGALGADQMYPRRIETNLNLTAAKQTGLFVPDHLRRKIDKVLQ
ncbi:MAG: ABC transporter substrate binding protein [Candidatus Krumholzibacteriia bacterium]